MASRERIKIDVEEFTRLCMQHGAGGAARLMGINQNTARHRARKLGIVVPDEARYRRGPRKWTPESAEAKRFAKLWTDGALRRTIAREFGFTIDQVNYVRVHLGLPSRGKDHSNITGKERPAKRRQRLVLEALRERGPMTATQLAAVTGMPYERAMQSAISLLTRKGKIEIVRGRKPYHYKLPHQEMKL